MRLHVIAGHDLQGMPAWPGLACQLGRVCKAPDKCCTGTAMHAHFQLLIACDSRPVQLKLSNPSKQTHYFTAVSPPSARGHARGLKSRTAATMRACDGHCRSRRPMPCAHACTAWDTQLSVTVPLLPPLTTPPTSCCVPLPFCAVASPNHTSCILLCSPSPWCCCLPISHLSHPAMIPFGFVCSWSSRTRCSGNRARGIDPAGGRLCAGQCVATVDAHTKACKLG